MRKPEQKPIPLSSLPKLRAHKGGAFANLILVGWLNDAGNYVIFVQNTETKKLQKLTSEPNKDHFRIIELRQNADPKLVEAVISNGTDQGTVKVAKRD